WCPVDPPCRMRSIVAKLQTGRLALVAAILATILAAWLSQGALSETGAGAGRVAIVPVTAAAAVIAIAAGLGVLPGARAGAALAPYWLLVLVLLPFAPAPLPPALLTWSGPLGWLIWIAIGFLVLSSLQARSGRQYRLSVTRDLEGRGGGAPRPGRKVR